MAFYYKPLSIFIYPLFLSSIASVCFFSLLEATKNGGITLDLIHRDSPMSPSYNPYNTRFERLNSAFHRSFSRKSSIGATSQKSTLNSRDLIESRLTPIGGEYLMKIQIGTPPMDIMAIADTGSDLTWTQCKPCPQCYKQRAPLFDPRRTKTYRSVSCQSDQCSAVGSSSCDSSNGCKYQVSYGDKSYSIGDLAVETIAFAKNVSFPKVVFGCGHENDGTFNETGSGIIGLGGGSLSIIRQLEKSIGGRFSYCLTFLDSQVSSKINFGTNAIVRGRKVVSTPIVRKSPDTFYYLTLEGVSVGNTRMDYNTVTKSKSNSSVDEGNIIIDSGTTLTFLPSELYEGLESALVKTIKAKRGSDPQGLFKLCYDIPNVGDFIPPPIVAHFKGADLVLPEGSTFIEVEKGLVCLTLLPSEDFAIFGNLHQMNYHIGYDLEKELVSFLPINCSMTH